jgi:hypothetical protein
MNVAQDIYQFVRVEPNSLVKFDVRAGSLYPVGGGGRATVEQLKSQRTAQIG